MSEEGMNFVRLFKVTGHFGKELTVTNADIYGEAQFITDLILDRIRNGNGIRIDSMGATHVKEAFVDTDLLYNRSILFTDFNKSFGRGFVKPEIRSGKEQIRVLPQRHGHRFAGLDTEFLGRDGLGQNDTGPLFSVSADGRWNQSDVFFSQTDSAGSLPGQESTIHINMKNESVHRMPPGISSQGDHAF